MGGRVRRRAGTMDPPPSTSFADEGRGEGAREDENDDEDDEDGRSIRRGFICTHSNGLSRGRAQRGGDTGGFMTQKHTFSARVDSIED